MVKCDEGKCILESLMCDGELDCVDGADEPATCGEDPTARRHVGWAESDYISQSLSYHGGPHSQRTLRPDPSVSSHPSVVGPPRLTSSEPWLWSPECAQSLPELENSVSSPHAMALRK